MPNTQQSKKRVRQNETRNLINRSKKTAAKTQTKKVLAAIKSGDAKTAEVEMRTAEKILKQLGAKNIISRKAADHKTSKLAKQVHALKAKA